MLTSPLQDPAVRHLVVVHAHRVQFRPGPLQHVLLAVPVLGVRPPLRRHRAVLPPVAVEAHVLLSVINVSGHTSHALRPVGEVAQALKLVHEILCGESPAGQSGPSPVAPAAATLTRLELWNRRRDLQFPLASAWRSRPGILPAALPSSARLLWGLRESAFLHPGKGGKPCPSLSL